ncbi:MAG: Lrp/AsnC family transcriptional regulator [Candidatus Omnitrophota bacterium]
MLTKTEKQILNFIQGDLPLKSFPYTHLAKKLNMAEDKIAEKIALLKKRGYIRRLGALVNHDMVGLKVNCMCVWKVSEEKIEKIGKLCAKAPAISHCYLRAIQRGWPYNFYTMVHAKTKSECLKTIKSIAKKSSVDDYEMLFTLKKFKKTSPIYSV